MSLSESDVTFAFGQYKQTLKICFGVGSAEGTKIQIVFVYYDLLK